MITKPGPDSADADRSQPHPHSLACNIAACWPLPSIGHRDTLLVETRPSLQVLDLDRLIPQGLNLGFQRERVYRPERGKELPESLRELFDTLRVIGPSEMKAKMEALRDLGVQMDMQDRSQLN